MSVSNLQNADVLRRERQRFAAAIREAAGDPAVAVVRMTFHTTRAGTTFHNVTGWTPTYIPLPLTIARQNAVRDLLLARRPDIDFGVAHEYHLDAAMLRSAPAAGALGFRPSVDRAFGGKDPVFLPRAIPTQRTRTEAA